MAPPKAPAENIPHKITKGYTKATAAKACAPDSLRKFASIKPGNEVSKAPTTPGTASLNMVGAKGASIRGDDPLIDYLEKLKRAECAG
jgi:hypothetical protein